MKQPTEGSTAYLLGPFTQVLTMRGLPLKGPLQDDQLDIIRDGGILVRDERIAEVGPYADLEAIHAAAQKISPASKMVVMPGLIDCHTHICFHGSRAADYARRLAGMSYLEIAQAGGGIKYSVRQTRSASESLLAQETVERLKRHRLDGITTVEIKSGYGLSVDEELKMLRAIRQAAESGICSVVPTCLAAHTIPEEYAGRSEAYLESMATELLPLVMQEGLAKRVDIFIEQTAFGLEEGERYLRRAAQLGFRLTVHADQFTPGSALLAAALGADSADHLEASGPDDIRALAQSETAAVALPGASLGLGMRMPPARALLDAGACLAIASDWNPGSAPMGDLLMQAAVLGAAEKLTMAETLAAMTCRAAHALRLDDRGRLDAGCLPHLAGFETDDYRDILYHQGRLKPAWVFTGTG